MLAHLFDKVKDIENYCPIFISFNGFSGIQPRSGESRLETLLRAIAVTLLQPSASTDTQSVSCDEGTLTDYLDGQKGVIVLMIDELNLLLPKGTQDDKVACFLRSVFLIPANRYLVFTTHEPIGDEVAEYTGKPGSISPRGVRTAAMPMSLNVTQQRGIPGCETLALGEVLFFSGIPCSAVSRIITTSELGSDSCASLRQLHPCYKASYDSFWKETQRRMILYGPLNAPPRCRRGGW